MHLNTENTYYSPNLILTAYEKRPPWNFFPV
jgi:hypothetical protein